MAEIVAKFIREFDARRERCWIAERDGEILGSVLLVRETDALAKLRLLLVEPKARGLGLGRRLVGGMPALRPPCRLRQEDALDRRGLHAARHIYEGAGFRLPPEEPHHAFGKGLVCQTWERDLLEAPSGNPTES